MKKWWLLLIVLLMFGCKNPSVEKLMSEEDLIESIENSIRSEYYHWYVQDNVIINRDKNLKVSYSDSVIKVVGLDQYNVEENILVELNYNTSSKQMKEHYEMLLVIQHKANVTKLVKQLD